MSEDEIKINKEEKENVEIQEKETKNEGNDEVIKSPSPSPKTLSPVDQWLGVTSELNFQKKLSLSIGAFSGVLALLVMILMFRSPIVAVLNDQQIVMLKAKRQAIPIGEKQIERIVKEFIKQRYQWRDLNPEEISKKIGPFVTDGLRKKVRPVLKDLKNNKLKGKAVTQEITDVEVQVTDKGVIAKFYKVLVVENLPLVIPTGLMLAVVKGARTFLNPEGVYINRVLENTIK